MRFLAVIAAAVLFVTGAYGQSVQQSGSATPNTSPIWSGTGIIKGGNTATDSPLNTFGVTRDAVDALCVSSDRSTAIGRNQLCFQAATSGPAKISLQNYGTANAQALQFIINGTTYPFPGALASLIISSTPVTGGVNGDCLTVAGGLLSQTPCSLLTAGTTGTGSIVFSNSPTLAGTIAGNLIFSGSETFSNNVSFTSSLTVNGIATPASAVGNTVILGTVSAPTLTNTGQAYLFNTSIGGATLQGDGSSFDVSLVNKNGGVAAEVPTGTTTFQMPGAVIMSGLSSGSCTSGIGLNSSNQAITVSCPGAAASIQVGSTTISSGTTGNLLYNNGGTLGNETVASILTAGTGIAVTGTTNATIACSQATAAAFGCIEVDNTSISASAGVVTSIAATKAQQQTGTDNNVNVKPAHQQDHDSAAKAICNFAGATPGTHACAFSYNVTSVTRTGTGAYTVTFTVPFTSVTSYGCTATSTNAGNNTYVEFSTAGTLVGSIAMFALTPPATAADPDDVTVVCFGRQ